MLITVVVDMALFNKNTLPVISLYRLITGNILSNTEVENIGCTQKFESLWSKKQI